MRGRSRLGWLVVVVGTLAVILTASAPAVGHSSLDSGAAQSDVLVVDEDGGDYETIQAAIDAAEDGDRIRVRAGQYSTIRVDKDVTVSTERAVIRGIEIVDDAAPTIEGFHIQKPLPEDAAGIIPVVASDTTGDWVLRDVQISGQDGFIDAEGSTGDWRIVGSTIELPFIADSSEGDWMITDTVIDGDIRAGESGGNWRISNSTAVTLDAVAATGDWEVRRSLLRNINARETGGNWRVVGSGVLGVNDRASIFAHAAVGQWTIQGSYLGTGLSVANTNSAWAVRNSWLEPRDVDRDIPEVSVRVNEAGDQWSIRESVVPGRFTSGSWRTTSEVIEERLLLVERQEILDMPPADARQNYWGQPSGPTVLEMMTDLNFTYFGEEGEGIRIDAPQCPDPLDCGQSLSSPPDSVPTRSDVLTLGPQRSLVVDEDGGPYEEIQPAIDAAPPGATIRVRAGEYDGFRVEKNVQIVTAGAAIDGTIRIAGDAAPVIEGFTVRNGQINARETGGDWILRDVTANSTAPDELGAADATKVDALDATGDWRVVNSEVTQIQAQRTDGDWIVANSTVASDLKAVESTGAWVVRASVIGLLGDADTIRLPAWESTGDWLVQDSAIIGTDTTALAADRARGAWRVRGSYLSAELFATDTTGPWTVRNSYIRGSGSGPGRNRQSITAGGSSGEWTVTESTIPGSVVAFNTDQTADATGNYWGQPGGTRDEQCRGNVDCGGALGRPPATIPPFLDRIDSPTANRAPTAVVSAPSGLQDGRTAITPGTELTLDGSQSIDPDGEIQSYEWSVDGQSTGTGPQFTRTFDVPRTYPVTLTVDDGQTTDSREIAVVVTQSVGNESDGEVPDNLPPVAALDAPETTVPTGETVTLSAAESEDLDGDAFAEFRWDLDDDGRVERTTAGPTTTVSFDDPGERSVSVVVVDTAGGTDSATTTVDVARRGSIPKVRLSVKPNEGSEYVAGPPITLDASGSVAPEGRIVAYEWSFGDGTTRRVDGDTRRNRLDPGEGGPAVPATTSHSYDVPGQYTVTVTVIDSEGRRASASRRIEVGGSDRVQIGGVSSSISGPMIEGVDLENEYAVRATGPSEIESVVFEFPNGETREAVRGRQFSGPKSWFVPNVEVDELTDPGTNVVEVRATDAEGRTGVETFAIDVFDPPGWFEFAMGPDPTLTRNDEGKYALQADQPTIPPDELIGPTFEFEVPVEEISGTYTVGVGANYGFEYVFADRLGTASGGGAISLTAPLDGLNLESDIGTDFGGSRSRSFSVDLSGTVRVTENGRRAQFERGRVAFGTEVSATTPIAGVAVYIPAVDTTVGIANVDLTLTEGFEPAVELEVNDARTALVPSEIELTNSLDLQVTAGVGSSVDLGVGRAGLEARGIVGTGAEFTTDVYPQLGVDQVTVGLRAGVRACLGPCGTEWLLNDDYPLLPREDDQTAQIAVQP